LLDGNPLCSISKPFILPHCRANILRKKMAIGGESNVATN